MKSSWLIHGLLACCTLSIIAVASTTGSSHRVQAAVPATTPVSSAIDASYYANPIPVWESHSSSRPFRTADLVDMIAQISQIPSGPSLPTPTPILIFPTPTPTPISPERAALLQQADFNQDGIINALDLLLFQSVWLEQVPAQ